MNVEYTSAELLECLGAGAYPVHSRFEAGFNLRVAGVLAFVGNKHGEQLPYGLLLSAGDAARLPRYLCPGETVFTWNPAERCLETAGFSLSLRAATPYTSLCETCCALSAQALEHFDRAAPLAAPTGLGSSIRALSDPAGEASADLGRAFASQAPEEIRGILRRWVGRGPGLTPSGDDLLTAVLLVDRLNPFLSPAFSKTLGALAEEGYTTDVSASYYYAALRGLFCASLLAFGRALANGDEPALRETMGRVLHFGHTSGRDMAAGLRLALAYLADRARERETGGHECV